MRSIYLLFPFAIISHFFIAKEYTFRILHQYTYDYLLIFYISLMFFSFAYFFKKTILWDIAIYIIAPYISSIISFIYISMRVSPQVVIDNFLGSIIIGLFLPYIALYAWVLSIILIAGRFFLHYTKKITKKC
ncbi:hypothetical protein BN1044_02319 [Hafnia alvei]|uniref:Uncharacterized protein n=1 Tax=Hafnia alvei TaxID=569 RepID=A0A1C6Z105_HAFAL|nr:hypothetical protein BN1044_02319 [Hafnia alvei]